MIFLFRVHHKPIVNTQALLPVVGKLQQLAFSKVNHLRVSTAHFFHYFQYFKETTSGNIMIPTFFFNAAIWIDKWAKPLQYLCKSIMQNFCHYISETWRSRIRASWYNYESKQQDATVQVNLSFILSQLYMFRAMFSPIVRGTWLCLQYLVVFTQVAASWCHGWVSTHPWHQPAATWVNTTRYCKHSQVPLMMGENIARNM